MNRKKICCMTLLLGLLFSFSGCGRIKELQEAEPVSAELSIEQMRSVCELATLECYYHNTAKLNSEKQVLFWNTSKKLWIEYSGTVKLGIDISRLEMKVEDDMVTITMPDAKVLDYKVDETSLSEDTFYSETTGLGSGKVNAEDQTKAFQEAQEGMLATVQEDETLLLQAKTRAQTLIENYVKNIGDLMGAEYRIQWETATDTGVRSSSLSLENSAF